MNQQLHRLFLLKSCLSSDLRGLFTSIMESSSNGLLTQVTQFWNLLDDLAESNPESYKNFIQQQLKEGKQLCAAPEPQLCLQTRILVCRVGALGWEVRNEMILQSPENSFPLATVTLTLRETAILDGK